jgi:hypothetical protein
MKRFAAAIAGVFLSLSFGSRAEQATGTVEAVYYEAAPGILQQWRPRIASRRLWVDVDMDGRKVLARVPEGMPVSPGRRIAVFLGEPKSMPLAQALPTTTVSRVTAPDPNASVGR